MWKKLQEGFKLCLYCGETLAKYEANYQKKTVSATPEKKVGKQVEATGTRIEKTAPVQNQQHENGKATPIKAVHIQAKPQQRK